MIMEKSSLKENASQVSESVTEDTFSIAKDEYIYQQHKNMKTYKGKTAW
jgi:hypothetical protein